MWANRITLDYIQHEAARAKVQSILNNKGATDEWITELLIRTDAGYVYYWITLSDESRFMVFDDGSMLE